MPSLSHAVYTLLAQGGGGGGGSGTALAAAAVAALAARRRRRRRRGGSGSGGGGDGGGVFDSGHRVKGQAGVADESCGECEGGEEETGKKGGCDESARGVGGKPAPGDGSCGRGGGGGAGSWRARLHGGGLRERAASVAGRGLLAVRGGQEEWRTANLRYDGRAVAFSSPVSMCLYS